MTAIAEKKIDGRSKEARAVRAQTESQTMSIDGDEEGNGSVRAAAPPQRQAARQPAREAARQLARQPAREASEVLGRNGEVLTRKRTGALDPFHVPPDMIPEGWAYQWNTVSVMGSTDACMSVSNSMYENGWRPVPASRHPGKFVPFGKSGDIVRDGQRLEERPAILSQQASAEDVRMAKQLISDRNDSLKLSGVKNAMPDGFAMSNRYRGTGGSIKMDIDRALDIEPPSHQLAEPGE